MKNPLILSWGAMVTIPLFTFFMYSKEEDFLLPNVMDGQKRDNIYPGLCVSVVLKEDQPTGKLTEGVVKDILTSSGFHPRGIKVRLESGEVGRVQVIEPGQV